MVPKNQTCLRQAGEAACAMFKWSNNPLKHYQTIYVYNNAAVVHIVILDRIQLPVQSPDWLIYYGEKIVTKYEHFVNCQLKRT